MTYINAGKGCNEKMCVIGFKLITHILNYMNSNIIAKSIKVEKVKNIVDIVLELLKKVS